MYLRLTTLFYFGLLATSLVAQDCPDRYVANSQAKVDSFRILYPDCTRMEGDLAAYNGFFDGGDTIRSLAGFNGIKAVDATFYLDVSYLEDGGAHEALAELELVRELVLINEGGSPLAPTILNKLVVVKFCLDLRGNVFSSFPRLERLQGDLPQLRITANDTWTSLNGMEQLSVGRLELSGLPNCQDLSALGEMEITNQLFVNRLPYFRGDEISNYPNGTIGLSSLPFFDPANGLPGATNLGQLTLADLRLVRDFDWLKDVRSLSGLRLSSLGEIQALALPAQLPPGLSTLELNGLPQLRDLTGLEEVRRLNTLTVTNNPRLISLDGLTSLTEVKNVYLSRNLVLEDISALNRATPFPDFETDPNNPGSIVFSANPALGSCQTAFLCKAITKAPRAVGLFGNGAQCSGTDDLLDFCERIGVEGLRAFPNPFFSDLRVLSLGGPDSRGEIFDATGRRVATFQPTNTNNLNLGHLPLGVYVLRITEDGEETLLRTLLKQ